MQPSSRATTVVTALAIVLALIGIGGVAFGAADKPSKHVAASDSTTTTLFPEASTVPGETTTTAAAAIAGGTTTTAKPGAPVTTSKPGGGATPTGCGDAPTTSATPGGNQAPAVGTYTYVSCSDSSSKQETQITAGDSSGGVTRRNVNANLGGSQQTSMLAFGPNGVLIEGLAFDSPQGRLHCDLNPDVVNYPADMHVGTQWSGSSTCDIKNDKNVTYGNIKLDTAGKVTDKVTTTVGGTSVNAWVVEGTITLVATIPSFGKQTTHISERGYYDPAHGLDVYRHTVASGDNGGDSTSDEKLTSLTPKS